MRVAWVHPSWRDLVIDELASDAEGRRRFLAAAGLDGVLLALSTAGGAGGERLLPLLVADADWDVLADRVHALAAELDARGHARLLDALRAAIRATDGRDPARHTEGIAIAEQALARATALWGDTAGELDVDLLRSWYALARSVTSAPPRPALDRTWAALLPAGPAVDPPSELYRLDAWLALCEVLADYDRAALKRFGFFDRHAALVADLAVLLDARVRAGKPLAASVLARLARVWPDIVDPALRLDEPAIEPLEPWRGSPPAPLPALLDIQRILRDLE
jgi:hypothetical protein